MPRKLRVAGTYFALTNSVESEVRDRSLNRNQLLSNLGQSSLRDDDGDTTKDGTTMKRNLLTALTLAVIASTATPLLLAEDASEINGRAVFNESKCVMCHGVVAEDLKAMAKSEKMLGPDLSGFKSDMEFAKVAAFMRGEIALEGAKHKKPFKGTDEELQAILDWLGSLEAQ
jgi:mono/diheme cytochrome c family protein